MTWGPGTSFLKYLAEDDQPRFQQLLGSSTGAGTFHVHLVDALGRKVPVQVFHTTWTDPDDNDNFLLGVQEEKEVDAFPVSPDIAIPRIQDAMAAEPRVTDDDAASSSSSNSSRSRSRSEFSSHSAWGKEPVYCLIKAETKLSLIHQSDQCRAIFVFDKEQDLLSYIHEPSPNAVMSWLQRIHLSKGKKRKSKSSVEPFGNVVLRNAAGVEYKVHLAAEFADDGEDTAYVLELELKLTPPAWASIKPEYEVLREARKGASESRRRLEARAADLPGVPDQLPSQPSIQTVAMSL